MYRGYDIAIDDSFDSGVVASAKNVTTNILKDPKESCFASTFRTGENILKINSVNGF
jgi:hypothetical protein